MILGGSGPIGGAYAVLDSKQVSQGPKIFVGSFAGSDADLAKIEAGDNAYRLTMGEPWPMYGWAVGQLTADWHAGKSIASAHPARRRWRRAVHPEQVREFRADMKDPQGTWENKRDKYVGLWGNINYENRGTYWPGHAADIPTSMARCRPRTLEPDMQRQADISSARSASGSGCAVLRIPGEGGEPAPKARLRWRSALVAYFSLTNEGFFTTDNGLTIVLNVSAILIVITGRGNC